MEPLQDTYTVRTRDGREYAGLTLASLRIALSQKIFSPDDSARSDRVAGSWTPLARLLTIPDQALKPSMPRGPEGAEPVRGVAPPPEPRVSTGIALDLGRDPLPPPPAPAPVRMALPVDPRPMAISAFEEEEGPMRHRLRIAGAYLLLGGILGMVGYAFGKHNPAQSVTMLVNTGLGIALLMNLPQVRKWAVGWVVAGWGLACVAGGLGGGCFGFVLVGIFSGLVYGGPACLLWGEECPRSRFWTGVGLMGFLAFLVVLGMILIAVAGAALAKQIGL